MNRVFPLMSGGGLVCFQVEINAEFDYCYSNPYTQILTTHYFLSISFPIFPSEQAGSEAENDMVCKLLLSNPYLLLKDMYPLSIPYLLHKDRYPPSNPYLLLKDMYPLSNPYLLLKDSHPLLNPTCSLKKGIHC